MKININNHELDFMNDYYRLSFYHRILAFEETIASKPESAYCYARDVVEGPWPMGELAIVKSGKFNYYYRRYILRDEDFIREN